MIYKNKDGEVLRVKFSSQKGKFIIPSRIADYKCSGIESKDFIDFVKLTDVKIPEGVTSIEEFAFYRCSSLASVNLENGLYFIECNAFDGCASLTNINIPDGVACISAYAFRGCSSLTSITIPESVIYIGEFAFKGCTNLNVTINSSEQNIHIAPNTFDGCKSVTWLK